MIKYNKTIQDKDLLIFSTFSFIFSFFLAYYSIHFFYQLETQFFSITMGICSLAFFFVSIFVIFKWLKTKESHINELEYNNKQDALTNIPNTNSFQDALKHEINKNRDNLKDDKNLHLLVIGIDRFKFINETFGYSFANSILVQVKNELLTVIDKDDFIGRLTGYDEFGIFTYKSNEEILPYLKKIHSIFGKKYIINKQNNSVYVNARIGVASYNTYSDNPNAEHLLHKSKVALEAAKNEYNCPFKIHNQTLERENNEYLELEKDLREAITNKELFVVFQPKIESKSQKVIGSEALIRWYSKKRNSFVYPDVFIPIAEDIGIIGKIGEFVLSESLKELKKWHNLGLSNLKVAVNVSTKQFTDELPNIIINNLQKYNISPEYLELEVTESALVTDEHNGTELLNKISEIGVNIAIDDFGTGYSSLSYLINFPLNVVKIDKKFIDKIDDKDQNVSKKGSAIVSTVIHLAHKIDCKVVAEGVETENQFNHLRNENCDIIQGYYFSKPLDKDDFINFVKTMNGID